MKLETWQGIFFFCFWKPVLGSLLPKLLCTLIQYVHPPKAFVSFISGHWGLFFKIILNWTGEDVSGEYFISFQHSFCRRVSRLLVVTFNAIRWIMKSSYWSRRISGILAKRDLRAFIFLSILLLQKWWSFLKILLIFSRKEPTLPIDHNFWDFPCFISVSVPVEQFNCVSPEDGRELNKPPTIWL